MARRGAHEAGGRGAIGVRAGAGEARGNGTGQGARACPAMSSRRSCHVSSTCASSGGGSCPAGSLELKRGQGRRLRPGLTAAPQPPTGPWAARRLVPSAQRSQGAWRVHCGGQPVSYGATKPALNVLRPRQHDLEGELVHALLALPVEGAHGAQCDGARHARRPRRPRVHREAVGRQQAPVPLEPGC